MHTNKIVEMGEQLRALREEITQAEEAFELAMAEKKKQRDELQEKLLATLTKEGLSSIKTTDGTNFTRATRQGYKFTDKIMPWAIEHNLVSPDKTAIAGVLKTMETLPEGVEVVETEYLSVRKPAEKRIPVDLFNLK